MTDNINELLYIVFEYHGHRCPALVMGLRSGLVAMRALAVGRSRDLELYVISETGRDHAGGCFLDGLMVATGCTCGKSNIDKTYCDKLAFTLVDVQGQRAVRVQLKSEYVETMMQSRFVKQRSKGTGLEEMSSGMMAPLIASARAKSASNPVDVGPIIDWEWNQTPSVYDTGYCDQCHEMTCAGKLIERDGKRF